MSGSIRRNRVLYLVHTLGKNGVTSQIRTLAEGVQAAGWDVAIAAAKLITDAPINASYMQKAGFPFYEVPFPDFIRSKDKGRIRQAAQSLGAMNQVVRDFRPDVIHTHGMGASLFALKARVFQRIPIISTCHATPPPRTRALAKRLGFLNHVTSPLLGTRIIAISYDVKKVLADLWKINPRRIRLVHNGVDASHFRLPSTDERLAARQAFSLAPDTPVVCLISRLYDFKGHTVLLKAVRRLHDEGITASVLFAGTGPYEPVIRQVTDSLHLSEHVHFLGFTNARQVLWASDVFVLPSLREGFALVVAEAMLCGVVPVRTPAGGATEQVEEGTSGFIVPFEDDTVLAQRLGQLFRDTTLRQTMAAKARTMALEKFTAEQMIQKTVSVYTEVLSNKSVIP